MVRAAQMFDLPTDLPINDVLAALQETLRRRPNAVLVAPPGAGKTTLVPLALLQAGLGGKILVLEPRRLAARAAATRMAALLGEPVGGRVGFRTRLEKAVSPATEIEVITEGLLTSRLLSDPGLSGVACVIFDEVHERSLEADLALALVLDLQRGLRPELRILAMSATADAGPLAALLDAPVIASDGRMHPVDVRHVPRDIPTARELPEAAAKAIKDALAAHQGDILVFLPGMAEIRRTEALLAGCPALVLPLHGDLPPEAQDLALRQHQKRRVVLATSIAETSLTVPGVRIVVDGGFRRAPRLDVSTGLTRLTTLRISRAAAIQRAGRAGREAPGVAIRLWSEALHRGLPNFDRPEIFEAELSGLVLGCAAWGERPEDLPFPDPPPAGAVAAGRALLTDLGALDAAEKLTAAGREMARLRATPRLAAMMVAAGTQQDKALAADLAAILEERDPLARKGDAPADILLRLDALAGKIEGDRGALSRIRQAGKIYRSRLGLAASAIAAGDAGALLAAAFPDRVGQSRGEPGAYRLSGLFGRQGLAGPARRGTGRRKPARHFAGAVQANPGVRLRSRNRQRADARAPAAGGADLIRPHAAGGPRRNSGRLGQGACNPAGSTGLERCGGQSAGQGGADANHRSAISRFVAAGSGRHDGGLAGAVSGRIYQSERGQKPRPDRDTARPVNPRPGATAGPGAAGGVAAAEWCGRRRLYRAGAGGCRQGPAFLRAGRDPAARRRQNRLATGPAFPRRAANRDHRGFEKILAQWLAGCQAGHARPLSETSLAGKSLGEG
jgi:hypothetical protein